MEIKVGQVWQNTKDEKFYIKEVCDKDSINSRVTFISLQNTDEYFAGEIGSCSYKCFMYQTRNLKLIEEDFSISEELNLEMKIKSKIKDIDYYKTKINDLQNKINTTTSELDELYNKLKEINPDNKSIIKIDNNYLTEEEAFNRIQEIRPE